MKTQEFSPLYKRLMSAYPGRLTPDMEDDWYGWFKKVPAQSLDKAIDALPFEQDIDPKFPPNAVQMVRLAQKQEGVNDFQSVQNRGAVVSPFDGSLFRKRMELLSKHVNGNGCDPDEWQQLANECDEAGVHSQATYVRQLFTRYTGQELAS